MRRTTAIKHLRALAQRCEHANPPDNDPVLVEAYAYGRVLEPGPNEPGQDEPGQDDLRVVDVALVLDLPVEEVTWWAIPGVAEWLITYLSLDEVPIRAQWRPSVWPVWNHAIRRPLRIWSLTGGVDAEALDALSAGQVDHVRLAAPGVAEEAEQLAAELDESLAHLRRVRDGWDDHEWWRDHKGGGVYPSDHLWRAANGYLDLLDAVGRTGVIADA